MTIRKKDEAIRISGVAPSVSEPCLALRLVEIALLSPLFTPRIFYDEMNLPFVYYVCTFFAVIITRLN